MLVNVEKGQKRHCVLMLLVMMETKVLFEVALGGKSLTTTGLHSTCNRCSQFAMLVGRCFASCRLLCLFLIKLRYLKKTCSDEQGQCLMVKIKSPSAIKASFLTNTWNN